MNWPNEIEKTNRRQARTSKQSEKLAGMMRGGLDELKQEIKQIRGGLTGETSDLPNPLADRRVN
jgi:hypothetical protein